jgi:transposase
VQTVLEQQPLSGHVFCFRGRRGDVVKLLWHDGDGLCLFQKRLERGRFVWPQATGGKVALSCRCCLRGSIGASRIAPGSLS